MSDETSNTGSPKWNLWAAAATGAVAAVAVAAARRRKQRSATTSAGTPRGDGWGNWRSRTYGGAVCSYHDHPTTHKDGDEYWCPHCWNASMHLFARRW